MTNALAYDSDYPYTSGTTRTTGECDADSHQGQVTISDFYGVKPGVVDYLKAGITQQPIAVGIEADSLVFHLYSGGVLDSTDCVTDLDHAVIAVGWGTDETAGDYYIVRNSWGASWGDKGYIKIAAVEGDGICGIQMQPSFPV